MAFYREIEKFITIIREAVPNAEEIFLNGECLALSRLLDISFSGGEIMYDPINGHFVYQNGKSFFDITGIIVKPEKLISIKEIELERLIDMIKK